MAAPLISSRLIALFADCCARFSTLAGIEVIFSDAQVEHVPLGAPKKSGQRRQLFYEHTHALDLTTRVDADKLLRAFALMLFELEEERSAIKPTGWYTDIQREALSTEHTALCRALKLGGFRVNERDITLVDQSRSFTHLIALSQALDLDGIIKQMGRLEHAAETDTDLAIGTAKEVLETICKSLLRERSVDVDENWAFAKLQKVTWGALKLSPHEVDSAKRGSDLIKQVLRGAGNVANGINELRNLYGTGHGRDGKFGGLEPRHAKLVVGMTMTLAVFLLETHHERP